MSRRPSGTREQRGEAAPARQSARGRRGVPDELGSAARGGTSRGDPPGIDVLIPEADLRARVTALGAAITHDYAGEPLVVIGVLKGSFIFLADLVRAIDLPLSVDFIGISSYQGTKTTGVVQITSDLTRPIDGKHVLLVEDIVDTGLTMRYLLENLATRRPASVKIAALLEKPARAQVKIPIDYRGFVIGDEFVVGYGLDWDGKMRNLPFVGVPRT